MNNKNKPKSGHPIPYKRIPYCNAAELAQLQHQQYKATKHVPTENAHKHREHPEKPVSPEITQFNAFMDDYVLKVNRNKMNIRGLTTDQSIQDFRRQVTNALTQNDDLLKYQRFAWLHGKTIEYVNSLNDKKKKNIAKNTLNKLERLILKISPESFL